MSRSRKALAKKRRVHVFRMKLGIVIAVFSLIVMTNFIIGNAANGTTKAKYYKSVEIKDGDSLWSIAKEHMDPENASVAEYIEEVKTMNSLESDNIQESDYIMVAYYDDAAIL